MKKFILFLLFIFFITHAPCNVLAEGKERRVVTSYPPSGEIKVYLFPHPRDDPFFDDETIIKYNPCLQKFPYKIWDSSELPPIEDIKYWIREGDAIRVDIARKEAEEKAKREKEDILKQKMGLNDEEWEDLKRLLTEIK